MRKKLETLQWCLASAWGRHILRFMLERKAFFFLLFFLLQYCRFTIFGNVFQLGCMDQRKGQGRKSIPVCMLGRQVFRWGSDNVVCTCKFKTRLWLWENKEARSNGREALLTGSSSAVALAAVDGRTSGAPQGTRIQLTLNWFKNTYLLHLWQWFEVASESLRDNSFDYQHWKDKWFLWQIKTVQNQRSRGKIYR